MVTDRDELDAIRRALDGTEIPPPGDSLARKVYEVARSEADSSAALRKLRGEESDDLNARLHRALKAMHEAREAVTIEGLTVTVRGHRVIVRGPLHLRMVAIERVTTAAQAHDWEREGVVFVFLAEDS